MVNWIEEYKRDQEKAKETILNEEYIDWLKDFISRKYRFCDTDKQYYSTRTDDYDRENIDLLPSLFNGVDYYASERDMYPYSCPFGIYYNVICDDFCFKIGMMVEQENCYFCERSSYIKDMSYIDYKDLVEECKSKEKKNKKDKTRRINS